MYALCSEAFAKEAESEFKPGQPAESARRYGVLLIFFLASLIGSATNARAENDIIQASPQYGLLEVCYATDRLQTENVYDRSRVITTFGDQRSPHLTFGCHQVSYPTSVALGSFEIATRDFEGFMNLSERASHYAIYSSEILDMEQMRDRVFAMRQSENRPMILEVHGYNTGHEAAILQAAQLHYDSTVQFSIFVFDWASKGSALDYIYDIDSVENSVDGFLTVLKELTHINSGEVHLRSHSMGARLILPALELALQNQSGQHILTRLGSVLLASPAIDWDNFRRLMEKLDGSLKVVNVYCAKTDLVLRAGSTLHGRQLAGYCLEDIDAEPKLYRTKLHILDVTKLSTCSSIPIFRVDALLSCRHSLHRRNPHLLSDMALYFAGADSPADRGPMFRQTRKSRFVSLWRARGSNE